MYEEIEVDPNDPNYDSDAQVREVGMVLLSPTLHSLSRSLQANLTFEEMEVTADVADKYVEPVILEYFFNGDLRDAIVRSDHSLYGI